MTVMIVFMIHDDCHDSFDDCRDRFDDCHDSFDDS